MTWAATFQHIRPLIGRSVKSPRSWAEQAVATSIDGIDLRFVSGRIAVISRPRQAGLDG
jgi:hypothetical protein